jgi:hypothetical protein
MPDGGWCSLLRGDTGHASGLNDQPLGSRTVKRTRNRRPRFLERSTVTLCPLSRRVPLRGQDPAGSPRRPLRPSGVSVASVNVQGLGSYHRSVWPAARAPGISKTVKGRWVRFHTFMLTSMWTQAVRTCGRLQDPEGAVGLNAKMQHTYAPCRERTRGRRRPPRHRPSIPTRGRCGAIRRLRLGLMPEG